MNHLDLGARSTLLPVGGQCLCSYALGGQAIQQMTADQRGEKSQLQDIQGQGGGRQLISNTGGKVQGAADHHEAEAKSCERHCVNMCGTT